ncbi:hypothetical protein [Actinospica sp.]|uniref:hypothetical protein n=1 Tax=Actinospica sp. TaxID=1872142 RepID=UPI002CA49C29|nr:hypothetical protein [Actinospica sp.]HWG28500.1 hypothetical protein [Actinospica sp.]
MAQMAAWNTPAGIEAEVRRLQAGIRQAGERAAVLAAPGPGSGDGDPAGYREAVGAVAVATRALVEYEAAIPRLQEGYHRHVSTLIARWSGGLLGLLGVAGGVAAALGVLPFWWLFPAIALAAAGLATLPGAARRAADPLIRPRLGACCYAVAGIVAVVCVCKALPPAAVLAAFGGCWVGLYAFRLLGTSSAGGEAR